MEVRARLAEVLEQRGYGAQSDLARSLGEHRNKINNWVRGTTEIHADDVPRIAAALGVTICDLYGVDEGHEPPAVMPATMALMQQLIDALAIGPERIQVNVYPGTPATDAPDDARPPRGLRFLRNYLRDWSSTPEDERQELRDFARAISEHEQGE